MNHSDKLTVPWRTIHMAIWLLGLAILYWQGWIWPGILVLIALSGVLEVVIQMAVPWRTIHIAIWLLGLTILDWQDWYWPGILVLIALSGILEAVIQRAVPTAVAPEYREHRPELLPHSCPKCNAPISGDDVRWTGPQSANCSYCGANLPVQEKAS